jgi:hypothetical protein
LVVDAFSQLPTRPGQAGAHSRRAKTQRDGDILDAVPVEVVQQQRESILLAQFEDGTFQRPEISPSGVFRGRTRRQCCPLSLSPPQMVCAEVAGDPGDPGSKAPPLAQTADFGKALDQSILREVLGVVRVAYHPETHRENLAGVAPHQLSVGAAITIAAAGYQLFFRLGVQIALPTLASAL